MKFIKNLFFLFLIIGLFSCNRFEKVETDDYVIKIPSVKMSELSQGDIDNYSFKGNKTNYSIVVLKKNKTSFVDVNKCIAEELAFFIKGRKTEKITTEEKEINGQKASIVSGVFYENNDSTKKVFWHFAVFQSQYYYYILRIYCNTSNLEKNKKVTSKIIESFKLKNN